jgi:hypothetical protein
MGWAPRLRRLLVEVRQAAGMVNSFSVYGFAMLGELLQQL